ncbi:MAG TPA: cytochrome c oxidase assembly protein [Candidatus Nanopelagicaceae bacterium]
MMLLAASIPSSGPFVNALTTISKFLTITASIAVVGVLLAISYLMEDDHGQLSARSLRMRSAVFWSAMLWVIAGAANIVLTLANILGSQISVALDFTTLRSFITQVTLGQYMFFQLLVALLVAGFVQNVKRIGATNLLLIIALVGISAPLFESHSASSGSHALAIGSIIVHVIALTVWVGGVFGLAILDPEDRALAVPRFSQLALWAVVAVVISGTANAWTRLNFRQAWHTNYALIVIAKVILTLLLIFIGYKHRKNLTSGEITRVDWSKFAKLITIELSIMIVALALGSWLSTNQPPIPALGTRFDAATTVAGLPMPGAPNFARVLFAFDPDALFIGILVLALALYFRGVAILKRQGDKWPVNRTVNFVIGCVIIEFATSGGLGVYAYFAFSYHMVAHMVLGMVAPIFIILGAPITLALRTLPQGRTPDERGVRGTLVAALHSRLVSIWVNPIVALALFDGSLFVLYLTPLFGGMMLSHTGHFVMDLHFILAGLLFFHVVIGVDPNPKRVPYLARIVLLFAAMAIHAFFSVALISSTTLLDHGYFAQLHRPWSTDLLSDQHLGGSLGWALGEIPIMIALVATFLLWNRDDAREARRIDRNAERAAAMGTPDELAEYNAYLAKLAVRDERDK